MKNRRTKLHKKHSKTEDTVCVELDTKCSCPPSIVGDHASIQFARRYLECQGSMPVRILRLYIEQVLPHSRMTQVSIYDHHERLLNDTDLLRDISPFSLSSSSLIALRFTMINTVTSFGHCLCSSPSETLKKDGSSSCAPTIEGETMHRTLSTCPLVPTPPHSPRSSLSPILSRSSMPIVNLLTPPSPPHYSSFLIDSLVESNSTDQSIIDQITSEFGEICPSVPTSKTKRQRLVKKPMSKSSPSSDIPLDLTMKKRLSSFDLFSRQSKWLKMI